MHVLHRFPRLTTVSALLFTASLSFSQAPAPRIRGAIERSPSVALQGSVNPRIRTANDLGPLPAETPISGITLAFRRTDAQEADLQQLLAQQADPSSPQYRHWLTPDEFATRFGVADSDIAATETWLQSHGFTIDEVSRSRDRITFSGTAAQIHEAFGAELHRYRTGSESHFAPASELSVPPALAPLTAAVLHLSDFRPKPSLRPQPQYTTAASQTHFLTPKDLSSMYDLSNFYSQNHGLSGQGMAIVGQSYVKLGTGTAVGDFLSTVANGSAMLINPVIVPGSGSEAIIPGDVSESEIDLEYASSLAPGQNVFFVYTGANTNYSVFDALVFAITRDVAPVISISYGACEPVMSTTDVQQYNVVLEQASAQGQTIVAASGDSGPMGCAQYDSSSGLSTAQLQGLSVNFPASSPNVTAVGGTQMASGTFAAGVSQYWTAATTSDLTQSLLSYVPEVAWNEDSPTYGLAASGGGVSSLFARPAWQTGVPGIPSGNFRLVPDIALQSSVNSPGYIVCTDDPDLVGSNVDCTNGTLQASNGQYLISGGTSFAAPVFAALLSVLNQYEQSTGFGNINPILYSLAAQPSVYVSAFHDITSGTTACAVGDGNCATPGTTGYAATPGYDMATGLGSLDFTNLAAAWPTTPANGAVGTYIQVFGQPTSANPGATSTIDLNVNVNCGSCSPPAPTGNVYISLDGATAVPTALAPPNALSLLSSATWNFVAPSTTGSHVVVVHYPGDAYHLPSNSTFSVLVGNVVPTGGVTLSASNLTVSNNGTGTSQLSITPTAGYNGMLTWSASYTGGTSSQTICYLVSAPVVNGTTTGTLKMGVGTACSSPTANVIPSTTQRASTQVPRPSSRRAPAAATFIALLLFGLLPSRRTRKLLPILSTAVLAVVTLTLTGCGGASGTVGSTGGSGSGGSGSGGSTGSSSGSSTTPQVYTIKLTAQDSVNTSITASTTLTLTVN